MFKEVLIFCAMLFSPVFLCFTDCLVRGIKAEIRERRERKESAIRA